MAMEPSPKRRRTNDILCNGEKSSSTIDPQSISHHRPSALTCDISPPSKRGPNGEHDIDEGVEFVTKASNRSSEKGKQSTVISSVNSSSDSSSKSTPCIISSPIHLTRVEELSQANNVDCPSLSDLIGDPLIKECWAFNYLFDVDFLL